METPFCFSRDSVARLNEKLSLPADGEEQDWDVELADPSRIKEFVSVYEEGRLTRGEKVALMALIIASLEEHLSNGTSVPDVWGRVERNLSGDFDLHEATVAYWTQEGDAEGHDPFRVASLLRSVRSHA